MESEALHKTGIKSSRFASVSPMACLLTGWELVMRGGMLL